MRATVRPRLTPEAMAKLVDFYRELREGDCTGAQRSAYRITVRQAGARARAHAHTEADRARTNTRARAGRARAQTSAESGGAKRRGGRLSRRSGSSRR